MTKETSTQESDSIRIIKNDEIDLIALAKVIWQGRKKIWISVLVFIVIGLLYAFLSPVTYRASAVVLPQTDTKSNLGSLGSLASLAGVNLSAMMGEANGIQPDLYPNVVNSYPFLNELIHTPLNYKGEPKSISFYEKEMADSVPGFGATVLKYTLRLPWTLKDLIIGKTDLQATKIGDQHELVALNKDEEQLFENFRDILSVDVDENSGLVTIGSEMEEPLISAQMANRAVGLLQDYVIRYKTSQVNENLKFIEGQYQEKKVEFEQAQKALFEYRDAYRNLVTERMDTRYQELQDAYNLSMSVYQGLAQQLEQAKIAVKKETPVFSVIEPVKVPIEKERPKRSMILVVSTFLGGFIGLGWIFGGLIYGKFRKEWSTE